MAYYECSLMSKDGVKLPESITLSGDTSAVLNPSIARANSTTPTIYTTGNCTIPTFGYHYANVTGGKIDSNSGNNIDISGKDSFRFDVTSVYKSAEWNIHHGSDGTYPYGGVTAKWTIVLHN